MLAAMNAVFDTNTVEHRSVIPLMVMVALWVGLMVSPVAVHDSTTPVCVNLSGGALVWLPNVTSVASVAPP